MDLSYKKPYAKFDNGPYKEAYKNNASSRA